MRQVDIPIVIQGSVNKSSDKLVWECPLFRAEIHGRGLSEKARIETREGNPAVNAIIGYIVAMELSPDDIRSKARLRFVCLCSTVLHAVRCVY